MAIKKNHQYFYFEDKTIIRCNGFDVIVDPDMGERLRILPLSVKVIHGDYFQVYVREAILARFIFGMVPTGMIVDHINRNSLDNRRANLRIATPAQNMANVLQRKRGSSTSRFKGVHVTNNHTYKAKISYQGKSLCLGTYQLEKDAAMAYDMAALEIWGEFAALTFPELLPIYQRRLGSDKSMQKVALGDDLELEVDP